MHGKNALNNGFFSVTLLQQNDFCRFFFAPVMAPLEHTGSVRFLYFYTSCEYTL
jgi:hypothetical protein